MDHQKRFERYLFEGDKEDAFRFAIERLAWDPESTSLRAMASFAFLALRDRSEARGMAREVLRDNPDEEFALAVIFSTTYKDSIEDEPQLFRDGALKLNPNWIAKFENLDMDTESRKLIYCIARYGTLPQKAYLSEEWLVNQSILREGLEKEYSKNGSPIQLHLPLRWAG